MSDLSFPGESINSFNSIKHKRNNGFLTKTSTMETPATTMETPATTMETPATTMETPATTMETPATTMETPATTMETPATTMETPVIGISGIMLSDPAKTKSNIDFKLQPMHTNKISKLTKSTSNLTPKQSILSPTDSSKIRKYIKNAIIITVLLSVITVFYFILTKKQSTIVTYNETPLTTSNNTGTYNIILPTSPNKPSTLPSTTSTIVNIPGGTLTTSSSVSNSGTLSSSSISISGSQVFTNDD